MTPKTATKIRRGILEIILTEKYMRLNSIDFIVLESTVFIRKRPPSEFTLQTVFSLQSCYFEVFNPEEDRRDRKSRSDSRSWVEDNRNDFRQLPISFSNIRRPI